MLQTMVGDRMAIQFPVRRGRRLLALASTAALAIGFAAAAQAGTVAPPELQPGKVSIIRDSWGMAHLYAAREEDGFYGLGYATAQDRLEQVLLLYLQAKGELAAKFGPGPVGADKVGPELGGAIDDAVASDRGALQWRLMDYARANLAKMQPDYRRDLEAYVAGIERYMADHPEKRPAWAPRIEPAMPLAIFTQLIQEGPQLCPAKIAAADGPAKPGEPQGAKGSDAWVIGPTRTADGGVVFSSDSHGPWKAIGTLFYPWRMKAGGVDFQAYEPTGTAMFFFGNTPHFAWGWTEAPRYPGDCYRVATQADDPRAYLFDGKLRRMETVPYSIAVKGSAPVTGTFEYTRHNGVLSPVVERRGAIAYVASFATAEEVGLEHRQLYDMAHARNRAELKAALQPMQLYPANLMVGGADGTQLYIRPGRTPKRPAGVDLTLPIDGNSSRAAWQGFVSYDESVHLENPAQDYIANDNVSPDSMYPEPVFRPADYAAHFAFDPGQTTSREVRNIALLAAARRVDDQGGIAIAMDEKVPGFEHWAEVIGGLDKAGAWPGRDADLGGFIAGLEAFDGVFTRDSRSALYFSSFFEALQSEAKHGLYDLAKAVTAGRPLDAEQARMVTAAVAAGHAALKAQFGRTDLVYGDRHRIARGERSWPIGGGGVFIGGGELHLDQDGARGPHPEILSPMRAIGFQPDPKDPKLVRAFCCQRVPFVVAFHPGGRLTSYAEVLPGINDDPQSPHFDDQLKLASDKALRPTDFYLDDLLNDAESSTELDVRP